MTAKQPFAELVVLNAKIYTVDLQFPHASALAVCDGRFLAVGSDAEVKSTIGPHTSIVDAEGRLVLPGLIDSHTHAFEGARADLFEVRLSAADDFERTLERVRMAARQKTGLWLKGAGWSLRKLITQLSAEPSLKLLDQATGDRPTVLRDSSHHAMFANSAAMKLAGITASTPPGENGSIVKYPNGALSGLFLEGACALIDKCIPAASDEEKRVTALHAVGLYNSFGVTGFTNALTSEAVLRLFKELDDEGKLSVWIAAYIATDSILTPERDGIGDAVIARRGTYRSRHIGVDFVKYFMDGVPGMRTAAFARPYATTTGGVPDFAAPFHSVTELRELIAPLDAQGIHVKVHAVGDQAIHDTLNAVAEVRRLNGPSGPQHSIAHLGYIFETDIPRLSQLNVLADLCPPLWFPNPVLRGNADVLGDERGQQAWPIGDIVRSGASVTVGTDWPIIATPNPWPGFAALITRKNPAGDADGVFRPEQAISLEQALPLCTINVAKSMGIEQHTGSISRNKFADFILLDRNLFEIPHEEIAGAKVLRTYFAGRLVYEA